VIVGLHEMPEKAAVSEVGGRRRPDPAGIGEISVPVDERDEVRLRQPRQPLAQESLGLPDGDPAREIFF
jgi:hypothetical protein